jgi:DNA-binding HxlR family transcriptional regulator
VDAADVIDGSEHRSGCPINLATEVLGDRWSLVVIRDVMFGNRRHFRELLTNSEEGIASNILAARLHRLTDIGLLSRSDDESHRQKIRY